MDTTTYPFRVTAETIGSRPRAKRQPRRAPCRSSATKTINLALQSGGAHGAFTWGVLDRLLEDGRITFEGVSAASAMHESRNLGVAR
jgi:hypothetical protein